MSEKQLPPELVDKMDKICLSQLDGTILNPMQVAQLSDLISEKCARIAVDYADEFRRQRDELLEALRKIHKISN